MAASSQRAGLSDRLCGHLASGLNQVLRQAVYRLYLK
jgi:hypothetical protein